MDKLIEFYAEIGISPAVYQYGERALDRLRERFEEIDRIAEYNQAKVLCAMQKNKVSAACFAAAEVACPSSTNFFAILNI